MGASEALSDLQLDKSYDGHKAYSLSKLCDAILSAEMHARYGDKVSFQNGLDGSPLACFLLRLLSVSRTQPRLTFNTMDPTAQCGCGCDTKMLRAG